MYHSTARFLETATFYIMGRKKTIQNNTFPANAFPPGPTSLLPSQHLCLPHSHPLHLSPFLLLTFFTCPSVGPLLGLESFWNTLLQCELAIGCSSCQENYSSTSSPQTAAPDRGERILVQVLSTATAFEDFYEETTSMRKNKVQHGLSKATVSVTGKHAAVQIFSTTTVPVRRIYSKMALQCHAFCQ